MRRTWIHQLLRRIIASQPSSRNGRRHSARLQVETLEGRCIPSVNVFFSGRVLVAQGDNNGNFIDLAHSGSATVLAGVTVGDTFFDSIDINSGNGDDHVFVTGTVKPTTINTGAGNDTVNIGGPVTLLDVRAPITVNGQGGESRRSTTTTRLTARPP